MKLGFRSATKYFMTRAINPCDAAILPLTNPEKLLAAIEAMVQEISAKYPSKIPGKRSAHANSSARVNSSAKQQSRPEGRLCLSTVETVEIVLEV